MESQSLAWLQSQLRKLREAHWWVVTQDYYHAAASIKQEIEQLESQIQLLEATNQINKEPSLWS